MRRSWADGSSVRFGSLTGLLTIWLVGMLYLLIATDARPGVDSGGHALLWGATALAFAATLPLLITHLWTAREDQGRASAGVSLDQLPLVVWTTDRDLRLTSCVVGEEARIGADPEVGTPLGELFGLQEEIPAITAHRRALIGDTVAFDCTWHGVPARAVVQPLYDGTDMVGVTGLALPDIAHFVPYQVTAEDEEPVLDEAGDDSSWVGLVAVDVSGLVTFVNRAAALALDLEIADLIGEPAHDVLHGFADPRFAHPADKCPIAATVVDESPRHLVSDWFWRSDGTPLQSECVVTPLQEDGRFIGAVIVFEREGRGDHSRDLLRIAASGELGGGLVVLPNQGSDAAPEREDALRLPPSS